MPLSTLALAAALALSPIVPVPPATTLSVLSYNVHGLPWPMAKHRPAALRQIGETLAAMRRTGGEPEVVLLQEAFTGQAKRIAELGGYPFAVTGPGRAARLNEAADPQQRRFAQADRVTKGEHDGKIEDSGLLVLSDYPIVSVTREPYPRFACAGFDCLANKGVLLVKVAVPGTSQPIAIVDTHMNSRGASGVDDARSDLAYRWQALSLRRFVADHLSADDAAIVAGDFNIGTASDRLADVTGDGGVLAGSSDAVRSAMAGAADDPDPVQTRAIAVHNKDWMFGRSGSRTTLTLERVTVPFGRRVDGTMLSDHMGYVATYRVGERTTS